MSDAGWSRIHKGHIELFPGEFRRVRVPEWRVLLALAYDGPSSMYSIQKGHGLQYAPVHRATKSLETSGWVTMVQRKRSQKGGSVLIYGLTLIGLLHVLRRMPGLGNLLDYQSTFSQGGKQKKQKNMLKDLNSEQKIGQHLAYSFDIDLVAEKNSHLLPLIFGRWDHFREIGASLEVFRYMAECAAFALELHDSNKTTSSTRKPLHRLFADSVYYRLLDSSLSTRPVSRRKEGYAPFNYEEVLLNQAVEIFKGDRELEAIFLKACSRLEAEASWLLRSARETRERITRTTKA